MRLHESHNWRYSDSSLYDAVCTQCNCTDNSSKAVFPCGNPPTPSKFLELAIQAGLKSPSELKLSPQEQKFAEFIVKECARVDSEENNIDHVDGETFNQTILRHFGVE